jgi:hypothetical protein
LPTSDIELTGGHIRRARSLACDVRDANAQRRCARQVESDAHVVGRTALNFDLRDARHRFDARLDDVLDEAAIALDRPFAPRQQLHEEERQLLVRIAAVAAELHDRPVRIARQRRQAAHAADDVDQRRFHVGADRERQEHLAAAGIRVAVDFFNAGQALQHLLLRLQQLRLDFLGRGAAPVGDDPDRGPFDVGKQLQGQLPQAEDAEQGNK